MRPTEEQLLAFLEETLDAEERARVQEQLAADPELAAELERAAAGLEALRSLEPSPAVTPSSTAGGGAGRVSPWWLVVAAVATLAVSIPATLFLGGRGPAAVAPAGGADEPGAPEFVLVLRGRWSDDIRLAPEEFEGRLDELREWTSRLAAEGVLIGASDLALEQGVRFGPPESPVPSQVPDTDYIVGVLTLRMDAYHEALAVARSCPHLRYGGTVTVRRAGAGFFTVRGKPDFSG
jgi:hypothetical protein